MLSLTVGHLAALAAVDSLALGRESTIAPDLLVVPKAVSLGNLWLLALLDDTIGAALVVFPLRREPAVMADLLIVPRTITHCTGIAVATLGPADLLPFAFYCFVIHLSPRLAFC